MPAASVHESPSVINIVLLVKIDCKKMAMLVLKHWIDADDEGVPPSVHTPQMHFDNLIRDGQEVPIHFSRQTIDEKTIESAYVQLKKGDVLITVSDGAFGLPEITVDAYEIKSGADTLYSSCAPTKERTTLKLIPYNSFANRGASDMAVWLREE